MRSGEGSAKFEGLRKQGAPNIVPQLVGFQYGKAAQQIVNPPMSCANGCTTGCLKVGGDAHLQDRRTYKYPQSNLGLKRVPFWLRGVYKGT